MNSCNFASHTGNEPIRPPSSHSFHQESTTKKSFGILKPKSYTDSSERTSSKKKYHIKQTKRKNIF